MSLPVHHELPPGLNHRTGLRTQGLVPTGPVVAQYTYRTRKGWLTCDLFDITQVRPIDPAASARAVQAHQHRRDRLHRALEDVWAEEEQDTLRRCQDDVRRAVRTFQRWHADSTLLILDSETTGLEGQVIDIAVVTVAGEVLLNTLVRPTVPVEATAREIHGITNALLATAPTWLEVARQLRAVVGDRPLLAYNAGFDRMRIAQTARAHGVVSSLEDHRRWRDAMTAYAPLNWHLRRGQEWRWASLATACAQQGVAPEPQVHRARGGALALARLVAAIATRPPEPPDTLPEGTRLGDE